MTKLDKIREYTTAVSKAQSWILSSDAYEAKRASFAGSIAKFSIRKWTRHRSAAVGLVFLFTFILMSMITDITAEYDLYTCADFQRPCDTWGNGRI